MASSSFASCDFDVHSERCASCACLADCLDSEPVVSIVPDPPREDAPLRVLPPWAAHGHHPHRDRRRYA
jgi:hypothetical protein